MCFIAASTHLLSFCAPYRSSLLPEVQQFLSGHSGRRVNISLQDRLWGPTGQPGSCSVLALLPWEAPALSQGWAALLLMLPGSLSQGACPSGSQSARTVPGCAVLSWSNTIACCCLLCRSPYVCKRLPQGPPLLRNMPLCPTELHLQPEFKDKSTEKFMTAAAEDWPSPGPLQRRGWATAQPGLHKPLGSFSEETGVGEGLEQEVTWGASLAATGLCFTLESWTQ